MKLTLLYSNYDEFEDSCCKRSWISSCDAMDILLRLLHIPSLWRQIGAYYRTFSFATIPQSNQSWAPSYHICSQLKSRCYYLEFNRPVAFHQSGLSCCQSFPYIFLFRLKLNQLL